MLKLIFFWLVKLSLQVAFLGWQRRGYPSAGPLVNCAAVSLFRSCSTNTQAAISIAGQRYALVFISYARNWSFDGATATCFPAGKGWPGW